MRVRAKYLAVILTLPCLAFAYELSEPKILSYLDEPLKVEIDISSDSTDGYLRLASTHEYLRLGFSPINIPLNIKLEGDNGHQKATITSIGKVDNPGFEILLETNKNGKPKFYNIPIMLDIKGQAVLNSAEKVTANALDNTANPDTVVVNSAMNPNPNTLTDEQSKGEKLLTKTEKAKFEKNESARLKAEKLEQSKQNKANIKNTLNDSSDPAIQETIKIKKVLAYKSSGTSFGPVIATDTLWNIAGRQGVQGLAQKEMVQALRMMNPKAFSGDKLKKGSILLIPDLSTKHYVEVKVKVKVPDHKIDRANDKKQNNKAIESTLAKWPVLNPDDASVQSIEKANGAVEMPDSEEKPRALTQLDSSLSSKDSEQKTAGIEAEKESAALKESVVSADKLEVDTSSYLIKQMIPAPDSGEHLLASDPNKNIVDIPNVAQSPVEVKAMVEPADEKKPQGEHSEDKKDLANAADQSSVSQTIGTIKDLKSVEDDNLQGKQRSASASVNTAIDLSESLFAKIMAEFRLILASLAILVVGVAGFMWRKKRRALQLLDQELVFTNTQILAPESDLNSLQVEEAQQKKAFLEEDDGAIIAPSFSFKSEMAFNEDNSQKEPQNFYSDIKLDTTDLNELENVSNERLSEEIDSGLSSDFPAEIAHLKEENILLTTDISSSSALEPSEMSDLAGFPELNTSQNRDVTDPSVAYGGDEINRIKLELAEAYLNFNPALASPVLLEIIESGSEIFKAKAQILLNNIQKDDETIVIEQDDTAAFYELEQHSKQLESQVKSQVDNESEAIKLELAETYMAFDTALAKPLLLEVLENGTEKQKQKAQQLFDII